MTLKKMGKKASKKSVAKLYQSTHPTSPPNMDLLPLTEANRLCEIFNFLKESDQERVLEDCNLVRMSSVFLLRMSKGQLTKVKGILDHYLKPYGRRVDDNWNDQESMFEVEDENDE